MYVHPGTPCVAQLATPYGTWHDVVGTTIHCRHIEASIHEWGLSFQYSLDPSVYCSAAKHWRALLVEDDPSCARLATFLLRQLSIEDVEHVQDGRAAVDKATRNTYDLILMDMEMPVLDGFSAAKELRLSGYRGPIIAMTGLTQAADRQRCLDAGCDRYLSKPVSRSDLSLLIESLSTEPLFSRFTDDADMTDIIDAFVGELPSKIQAIEEAAARRDGKRLEFLARGLKAVGSGYGFEAITDAAAKIEAALIDGASPGEVQSDVCALSSLCLRVRSRPGPEHPCDNKAETGSGTEDARPRDPRTTDSSHPDA
jgi:CheY-like chemotaxis protein